jgi:hypothetical protein
MYLARSTNLEVFFMQFSPLSSYFVFLFPNIFLSTLFFNPLSACVSSHNVGD